MSDTATAAPAPQAAPAPAAPESTAPSGEPKPGDPKPSRFRTDANLAADPLLNKPRLAPIRETPPKDPATGKFVSQGGDPNAGVIPELRREAAPQNAPEPEPEPEPAAPEPTAASTFAPVEIDLGDGRVSVFKTKEALEAHFKRMQAQQSDTARRLAERERLDKEREDKAKPAEVAPPKLENPFEKSFLDDEGLLAKLHADLEDPDLGPAVAISRLGDNLEKRTRELAKFMQSQFEEAMAPMQSFLGAMNTINNTATFFQQMVQNPKYGEVKSRRDITALTTIMSRHSLPLTPENFDLAYQVWRGTSNPGAQQPPQVQPPQNMQAAASAAAVMSSRGTRVPDPRAEKRTLTFRDEMEAVPMARGRFRVDHGTS